MVDDDSKGKEKGNTKNQSEEEGGANVMIDEAKK